MAFSSSRAIIWFLNKNKNVVTTKSVAPNGLLSIAYYQASYKCLYATDTNFDEDLQAAALGLQKNKLSKSMKAYMMRSKEHNEFMNKARAEYQIGKRHLANMMGENPDDFSDNDVKNAIEYLFPSGIYDKQARPLMKPADEVFPPRKAAEFDESGRPYNSMFYTCRPNYYQTLHKIVEQMTMLDEKEDKLYKAGSRPNEIVKINLDSTIWMTKPELETFLYEQLTDPLYEYFVTTIERLVSHPLSHEAKDFITQYRKEYKNIFNSVEVLPIEYDTDGRPFVTVSDCKRKSCRGQVILRGNGSGKITINGEDISYFKSWQCREQILFPLIFAGMEDQIDVEAKVEMGGTTGQSGAIRWGIAWGLRSFVDKDMIEKMKVAGLLTRDWRTRERKKFGQAGARKKFTWKRR